ncbi:hypothetical protein CBER1_03650 [Cercospora berteroae]|uniref:Uncharacterized protein n=1 Tax=Cercospora berteroae TaxID=357750 RepID=A0A2S6CLM3_9PEZI|nr:hypothetical protein CBER1_03650 [Cercospora berteroae]
MKRTGVVLGLKNIINKIHPSGNAPLTTSESKRLLTALTSSFRKHLDAVHPSDVAEDSKTRPELNAGFPNVSHKSMHSSAALAQKHMASVLTNPLLVKGGKDFGTAKVELQKNPYRDPIALLEEYDQEGAATVRIAELCLDHVRKDYDTARDAQKPRLLDELQPGRRVFLWLLRSNLYTSESYADNVRFLENLVFFLLHEGREENIWQWIKLDVKAADSLEGPPPGVTSSLRRESLYRYRWRGRLLSATLRAKAGVTRGPAPSGTIQQFRSGGLNAALDTYVAATKLMPQLTCLPLSGASTYLSKLLTRRLRSVNPRGDVELAPGEKIDGERYDKLIEALPLAFSSYEGPVDPNKQAIREAFSQNDAAMLLLFHPYKPSATHYLQNLKSFFPDDLSHAHSSMTGRVKNDLGTFENWDTMKMPLGSEVEFPYTFQKGALVPNRMSAKSISGWEEEIPYKSGKKYLDQRAFHFQASLELSISSILGYDSFIPRLSS